MDRSKLLLAAPLALILALGTPSVASAATSTGSVSASTSTSSAADQAIATVLADFNAQRKAANLPALNIDSTLASLASGSAAKSAAAKKAGFDSEAMGKLPAGALSSAQLYASGYSPAKITAAFMESANSKSYILNLVHNRVGIGVAYDSAGKIYYNIILAGYQTAEQIADAKVSVSKPLNLVAKASTGRIDLSWDAVSYEGVLSPYRVLATDGTGKTQTLETRETKLSLTNLAPQTSYSITVEARATSKDGQSTRTASGNIGATTPAGPAATPTPTAPPTATPTPTPTPTAPNTSDPTEVQVGAPASIRTTAKATTSMTVAWTPPTVLRGKITKYTLQVTGTGYSKTFTVSPTGLSQQVTGLTANTPYTVVVTAHASSLDGKNTRSAKRTTTISTVKVLTQADVDRIIADTNSYRAAAGLPALKQDTGLNNLAKSWSTVQAKEQRRYHNPNLRTQTPGNWKAIGENIANGYTVETVTKAWYDSTGHRANMLSKDFTHIGVGLAYDSNGMLYYTQNFAKY